MTPETFQTTSNQRFADNELMRIRPAHFRAFAADILATFVARVAANVPEYDPTYYYVVATLVTFNGRFFRARQEGLLAEPVPGQETPDWEPEAEPLAPLLPYRELSVIQAQDYAREGSLQPGTLYRLTERGDDDVLAVAMTRHHLAGADAYVVGLDEQYLRPVSYDLAADTTAERASGGAALAPATPTTLGGIIVGTGLRVEGTGKLSLKIDSNTLGVTADGALYVLPASGNISPAATPTNVTAVRDHPRTGTLVSWDAMPGATWYQVYRSENGGPWGLVIGIPYPRHFDTQGPAQGDQFILYRVTAANSAGESNPSSIAQAQ